MQSKICIRVALGLAAPARFRHLLAALPSTVPLSRKDHFWLAPPWHVQIITLVLLAVPPPETVQGRGKEATPRGGNPAVWEAVSAGKKQVMAWAYDRPDGGRIRVR